MNVSISEAENGFMKGMYCKVAVGFGSWEVTADFRDSNFV